VNRADAVVIVNVEIVKSYPGVVNTLLLRIQSVEITASISRLCFENIVLIAAAIEILQAAPKGIVKSVLGDS